MKLGIYGGTFNPVHLGHLHFAVTAADALELDKVLLIINSIPPHKSGEESISAGHRLNLCRLACQCDPRLEVCDIEVKRGGKSYTIDTVRELTVLYPEAELFLLVGTDMFCSLQEWKCFEDVMGMVCPVGAPRLGGDLVKLLEQKGRLKARGYESIVLDLEPVPVSSSEIRAGEEDELPLKVRRYIEQNGLYGSDMKLGLDLDALTQTLRETLSRERFNHSLNVANEALRLADKYNGNPELCYLAGLLHDICKEMDLETMLPILHSSDIILDKPFLASPRIWHGFAASIYLPRELSVFNTQILDAIRYHSSGRQNMTLTDKIIYMADLICAERCYEGVEGLRQKAHRNLDAALLEAISFIVGDLVKKGLPVTTDTFNAYNQLVLSPEAQQ